VRLLPFERVEERLLFKIFQAGFVIGWVLSKAVTAPVSMWHSLYLAASFRVRFSTEGASDRGRANSCNMSIIKALGTNSDPKTRVIEFCP
jgi:hypothetical protein